MGDQEGPKAHCRLGVGHTPVIPAPQSASEVEAEACYFKVSLDLSEIV